METILLTEREVRELVGMEEAINAVEEAFRLHGFSKYQMPAKVYLYFDTGDLRAMPAEIMGYAGVKWVNSHPDNPARGLPTVMALLILNDPANGFPLAVMDATYLTSLRTGAAGGVAAKYLAKKDSKVVGFIGCGKQAMFQLEAIRLVFDIEKVLGYDISGDAIRRFSKFCSERGIDFAETDAKNACKCDILVTTTPSRQPVVSGRWIGEGVHINAIGADAPGKQELDIEILLRSKIIVDDIEQALHGGEINVAVSKGMLHRSDIFATLGEVVAKLKPGRESDAEITIFDSTGLAIQDIAVAKMAYEKAVKEGVGKRIKFFEA